MNDKSTKRCPHPGPNQQGFEEYVSVLDGPGAPRQNELQVMNKLYVLLCLCAYVLMLIGLIGLCHGYLSMHGYHIEGSYRVEWCIGEPMLVFFYRTLQYTISLA